MFGRSFFMHIYNPEQYPNLLPKISLTSDEIKAMVSTYKLTFLAERNYEVEWGKGLPMFVPAFYDFILNTNRIPNPYWCDHVMSRSPVMSRSYWKPHSQHLNLDLAIFFPCMCNCKQFFQVSPL